MKKILVLPAMIATATSAVLAQDAVPGAADEMFETASGFISGLEAPLSAMLVAAFGIVVVFVAYKLAKRAINKV